MKIKQGFVLRKVAENYIVVPVGEMAKKFNGVIKLNESSAFMWKKLEQGIEFNDLVKALTEEYDVDTTRAENDAKAFTDALRQANVAE